MLANKIKTYSSRTTMENSTAHRVIKNTGYLYAKMGITMFVSLYTTRLILNGLGAADFGSSTSLAGPLPCSAFLMQPERSHQFDFPHHLQLLTKDKQDKKLTTNISTRPTH